MAQFNLFKKQLLVIETNDRMQHWYGDGIDDPCMIVSIAKDEETWGNEIDNIPCSMFANFEELIDNDKLNGKIVYVYDGILGNLEDILLSNKENHIDDLIALFEYERNK